MLLSESEKNRIKSLYGFVTEAEIAPPDESRLIANKNPFKYEEFKDARTFYSPSMINGDRFYQIKGEKINGYLNQNMTSNLTDYYQKNIFRKIEEQIEGKTVRIPQTDKISTITVEYSDYWGMGNVEDNWYQVTIDNTSENIDLLKFNIDLNLSYIGTIKVRYQQNLDTSLLLPFGTASKYIPNSFKDYIKQTINTIVNGMEPFKMSNFDDHNFEIREVQRKQTDF